MQHGLRAARFAPLAIALLSSTAMAAPAVTVSPSGNHPKGSTAVSGTGFGANQLVDVYFDTADELLAATNASGKFGPDTITIPASALPGTHFVTAAQRSNGVAAQHAFLVRTRWSSVGFNEVGRRRNPYENTIDASNVGNLDLAWSAPTGAAIFSSPAIAQITATYNPYIFVGSFDHKVYAFDSTGAMVWKKTTGNIVASSPAVASNSVYVGSEDGKLYAFNAATGAAAWTSPATTGGPIDSSPAVANGIVYVGSNDGKLYAFHTSDGTAAWASPAVTGASISYSSPAVANGIVYVASTDDKIYAFSAATGVATWSTPFTTGNPINGSPAVAGGVVYFGSVNDSIYALNASTGLYKWSVTFGGSISSSPAVANGVVYIGTDSSQIYALNAETAEILWAGALAGAAGWSSPAVANGVVFIGSETGNEIEAFNANGCGAANCTPLWTASAGNNINARPAISDGVVYSASYDGRLYAYALDGGNNAAYRFRKGTLRPPSYASLHPDMRLKPVKH